MAIVLELTEEEKKIIKNEYAKFYYLNEQMQVETIDFMHPEIKNYNFNKTWWMIEKLIKNDEILKKQQIHLLNIIQILLK